MSKELPKVKYGRRYIHLKSYLPEEILSLVDKGASGEFEVDGTIYPAKLQSGRLHCFKRSLVCAKCGRVGTIMSLDKNRNDPNGNPHFNLYCQEGKKFILMTKDHIIPKSKGGKNHSDNYQTMCEECNGNKADLTEEQLEAIEENKLGLSDKPNFVKHEASKKVFSIVMQFDHGISTKQADKLINRIKGQIKTI